MSAGPPETGCRHPDFVMAALVAILLLLNAPGANFTPFRVRA